MYAAYKSPHLREKLIKDKFQSRAAISLKFGLSNLLLNITTLLFTKCSEDDFKANYLLLHS